MIVDIEITAKVHIEEYELYEHQQAMRDMKELIDKGECDPSHVECECWKETATAKEIAECIAFDRYLNDTQSIDLSWHGCTARHPNLPLDPLTDE